MGCCNCDGTNTCGFQGCDKSCCWFSLSEPKILSANNQPIKYTAPKRDDLDRTELIIAFILVILITGLVISFRK